MHWSQMLSHEVFLQYVLLLYVCHNADVCRTHAVNNAFDSAANMYLASVSSS